MSEEQQRKIVLRRKDLNAKGNGTQETRRVRLPDGRHDWATAIAENVEGSWSSGTFLAVDRSASQVGLVPVGTLVLHYESPFRGGRKSGTATVEGGVVVSLEEGCAVRVARGLADGKSDSIRWGLSTRQYNNESQVQLNGEWYTV